VIAGDSSSLVAYFAGESGADVEAVDAALNDGHLVLPCVALTELLSAKKLPAALSRALLEIPSLEPGVGFWERAGGLRAKILRRGRRARLADTLIAQLCIDHNVSLVTRDEDFRHFVTIGGLVLS
jgi:predicted nucleic acid-binding protein